MPLVTITTSESWSPNLLTTDERQELGTNNPLDVLEFGRALPELISNAALHIRGVDELTAPDSVQVDFVTFSRWAVNAVDIWIHIVFTEDPEEMDVEEAKLVLTSAFRRWTQDKGLSWFKKRGPTIALDIFAGPGHGWIYSGSRELHEW